MATSCRDTSCARYSLVSPTGSSWRVIVVTDSFTPPPGAAPPPSARPEHAPTITRRGAIHRAIGAIVRRPAASRNALVSMSVNGSGRRSTHQLAFGAGLVGAAGQKIVEARREEARHQALDHVGALREDRFARRR